MDVHAGRAVVDGPRNYLTNFYRWVPISITVEGANIMSRNLLIFGQGSMACHPYIRDEFYAIANQDKEAFKVIIMETYSLFHAKFCESNLLCMDRWIIYSCSGCKMRKEYQRLTRLSQAYAWLSDLSLIKLGGDLKRKERLSARLADGISYLYMAMAALRASAIKW